jgi:DNA-binding beta-propeller fold protein YncE
MSLQRSDSIDLPAHVKQGGFDHAAIHHRSKRLYVAHTANDAADVIDCGTERYLHSIPDLLGVAGVLVSEERNLVFTSNRGENSIGIFSPDTDTDVAKVSVGIRPNGMAYDPERHLLLVANVGDPSIAGSCTISIVDVNARAMIANFRVAGRTRWAVFDARTGTFYVNIADPPEIVVVNATKPTYVARTLGVPATGPHGLDLDTQHDRLFCACDGKKLIGVNAQSGQVTDETDLSGVPDVIFFNAALQHLYVAVGEPGVIDVFDTQGMKRMSTVQTEQGAHTIAFDPSSNKVYAFLPNTHRAAVYVDKAG